MTTTHWEIGTLHLRFTVVWGHALSSLKLRFSRSLLTVLTIATATAFMMYLLTMAKSEVAAVSDEQSWLLMMLLALVVSAAGVLNTMLMNVTQRYREIGTMKCLGALDSFILLSVLLEAAILGLAGAAIGVVAGTVISVALALADFGRECLQRMSLGAFPVKMIFVFTVGMLLTTLGAAVPAFIASRMPPMDAMRGEK